MNMKPYPEKMKLEDVWEQFERGGMAHLATIEGDQPRVRMMSLTAYDGKFWLATWSNWRKVEQIKANPKVEFSYGYRGEKGVGAFRVTGIAHIVDDPNIREEVSKAIPWFGGYWESSEDPRWTCIQIEPKEILLDHPDDKKKYTIEI